METPASEDQPASAAPAYLCNYLFLAGVQQSAASLLAAEKNMAGRAVQLKPLLRSVYPEQHLPSEAERVAQLARFCFPHGVLPSPRPQPINSFVTALTMDGTGERLFLHVLIFPERYGTRLWVPACIACAGRILLPDLFRPYLEQLQLRWAAIAALQLGLSEEHVGPQVAADFGSSWQVMTRGLVLAPDIRLPPRDMLTAFELGDTLFCFATPPHDSPPTGLRKPTLPTPPPTRTHVYLTRRLYVPPPPALTARLLGLLLSGSQILVFSRSATLLTLTLEACLELLAPLAWAGSYMPLLPDVAMLDALQQHGPFLMGCLHQTSVFGGSVQDSDPRQRVSAEYAQRIQPSCYCFDLDQREEVGECAETELPMPPAMSLAIEAALAAFEAEAHDIAALHQRTHSLLHPESESLENANPEHLQLQLAPSITKAAAYDQPTTFQPPRSVSRRELERRTSRPPAAAIVAGVVRDSTADRAKPAELPYEPEREIPEPPTELRRVTAEQVAERRNIALSSMTAHLDAAKSLHAAEEKLLTAVRAEIERLCPSEGGVAETPPGKGTAKSKKKNGGTDTANAPLDATAGDGADDPDAALERAKAAVLAAMPKTHAGFGSAVVHGLFGPTPWLRREVPAFSGP